MDRRYFFKTISVLAFASSSAFLMVSYAGRLFYKIPSIYSDDLDVKDKIAFTSSVYPLFSDEHLLDDANVILARKGEWATIQKTFFAYYYGERKNISSDFPFLKIFSSTRGDKSNNNQRFASLSSNKREDIIVEYIHYAKNNTKKSLMHLILQGTLC
ncbi:hypothetical protein [Desulfamplus magnetovallimortis]|nr:hypothetical protein [Desulfamplus magnetovallimortis]